MDHVSAMTGITSTITTPGLASTRSGTRLPIVLSQLHLTQLFLGPAKRSVSTCPESRDGKGDSAFHNAEKLNTLKPSKFSFVSVSSKRRALSPAAPRMSKANRGAPFRQTIFLNNHLVASGLRDPTASFFNN